MRKTARPVVWEGGRAQSRPLDPIRSGDPLHDLTRLPHHHQRVGPEYGLFSLRGATQLFRFQSKISKELIIVANYEAASRLHLSVELPLLFNILLDFFSVILLNSV